MALDDKSEPNYVTRAVGQEDLNKFFRNFLKENNVSHLDAVNNLTQAFMISFTLLLECVEENKIDNLISSLDVYGVKMIEFGCRLAKDYNYFIVDNEIIEE